MPQGGKRSSAASPSQSDEGFTISGKEVAEEALGTAVTTDKQPDGEGFVMPCSINGVMAGLSGGTLGYVIGFGSKLVGHKGSNRFAACRREGWTTGKSFAVFGGVFAAATCMIQRLRQKQDALNGGLAGCVTGLVLGWNGGPAAALQSAAMMGAFSYVIERMQGSEASASSSSPQQGLVEPLRDAVCPRLPNKPQLRNAAHGTARFPRR